MSKQEQKPLNRTLTRSPEALIQFSKELASKLTPGVVIALKGELGAGKTHFAKGLLKGLGYEGDVTSPTFTLVNEYHGGELPVFHYDFYRSESMEEVEETGWDDFLERKGVTIVEWADLFPRLFPEVGTIYFELRHHPEGREVIEWSAFS